MLTLSIIVSASFVNFICPIIGCSYVVQHFARIREVLVERAMRRSNWRSEALTYTAASVAISRAQSISSLGANRVNEAGEFRWSLAAVRSSNWKSESRYLYSERCQWQRYFCDRGGGSRKPAVRRDLVNWGGFRAATPFFYETLVEPEYLPLYTNCIGLTTWSSLVSGVLVLAA